MKKAETVLYFSCPGFCCGKACGIIFYSGAVAPGERKIFMSLLFVEYPPCSTCKKAKKWLDAHGITYTDRNIKEKNPSAEELRQWHQKSGLPLKKFFNTSGTLYKSLNLKEKLSSMSEDEQFALLASDGMLVKRPVLAGDRFVLVGFREDDWSRVLL